MDNKLFDICMQKKNKQIPVTWAELAEKHGYINGEALRSACKNEQKKRGILTSQKSIEENIKKIIDDGDFEKIKTEMPSTVQYTCNENGGVKEIQSDRIIAICEIDQKSPKIMLEAHKFNPDEWDLVSCRNNLWHMPVKGGGKQVLYQSRIVVKPKRPELWTRKIVDNLFDSIELKQSQLSTFIPEVQDYQENIFVVGIADFHLGLLTTEHSVGDEYNIDVAEDIYFKTISRIIGNIQEGQFEKIILPIGNDFINFDNTNNTTTRGTLQENTSIWYDVYDKALEIIIKTINTFLQYAPVEVVYVPSNHDNNSMYGIMRSIDLYYKNNNSVTTDYSPMPRKYIKYGKNLIGFTHDLQIKNALKIMTTEAKDDWSECEHMVWFLAHLHSGMAYERQGYLEIYRFSTLSGISRWSNNKGYVQAHRETNCYVFDKENGIVGTKRIIV